MTDRPLFDGDTFDPTEDEPRLTRQIDRVYRMMLDREWWTLRYLADQTGASEAAVSARLRDLRKAWWGGHVVDRRRDVVVDGLWLYRLIPAECGLLSGQRSHDPKLLARQRIVAYLDRWEQLHPDRNEIHGVATSSGAVYLLASDIREMLK